MKRGVVPLIAFAAVLVIAAHRLAPLQPPKFPAITAHNKLVLAEPPSATLLPPYGTSAHSVSLTSLSDGRVAAAWFSGSREGAADVAIVFSSFDGGSWSPARAIAERATVEKNTGRLIRKLGNPVLWRDPYGTLHCWFVSVSYGGWAGSAINHMASSDDGQHWGRIERLITSPFLNLSTLVRNPPLALADGGIALPVYHEFIAKRPEWLRLDATGRIVDKLRLPGSDKLLQPAAVAIDQDRALALLRDAGTQHKIYQARSSDAGASWTPATATSLPNPDAGIALLRLHDGALLLAYNPLPANRNRLALAVSRDDGLSWSAPRDVEAGGGDDEFSYPALLQDDSGWVHLAYTWKRERIKDLRFAPAWVEAGS